MKKRIGFVSNSSSSSFVMIGTRIPREELCEMGWYDEDGPTDKVPEGISIYYDESAYLVGIPLAKSRDWGFENVEIDAVKIQEMISRTYYLLDRDVKLLIGTRPT